MLHGLPLKNAGPAPELALPPLAPRLNLITGDNGLGKSLSPLGADGMDSTATVAMERIEAVPIKEKYCRDDIVALVATEDGSGFNTAILCARLFLGLSKDQSESQLKEHLGHREIGIRRFNADRRTYLHVLEDMGLCEAMTTTVNVKPV